MDGYSEKMELIRKSYSDASEALLKNFQAKLDLLTEIKQEISSNIVDVLCYGMISGVEKRVESQTTKMHEGIELIDHNLTESNATLSKLTEIRRQFMSLYNSATTPSISVEIKDEDTCTSNEETALVIDKIQKETQDVVESINDIRSQHEPLLTELQNSLSQLVDDTFGQLESQMVSMNETVWKSAESAKSAIEAELSAAQAMYEKFSSIKSRIHTLLQKGDQ